MRYTLFSLLLLLAVSCKNTATETEETTTASENVESVTANFEQLDFDKLLIPVEAKARGERVGGAGWKDQNGLNTLVAYLYTEGEYFDDSWTSELHIKCLTTKDNKTQVLWEINEANPNIYSGMDFIAETLKVDDLDKDGIGEPRFMYAISPDGLDPATMKYVIHHKGEPLVIEGQLPAVLEDFEELYEKKISPAFDKHPPVLKEKASKEWDAYIAMEKEEME